VVTNFLKNAHMVFKLSTTSQNILKKKTTNQKTLLYWPNLLLKLFITTKLILQLISR